MGSEYQLHIGIQFTYHADKFLLPLDVKGSLGLVHKENTMGIIAHQHSEQDSQHLFFTGRKFIGQQTFTVLIEDDFIAAAIYAFAGITEQLVHQVLKLSLGQREGSSLRTLFLIA